MDTDEDFHVKFVYEEDPPPTDAVRSRSTYRLSLRYGNAQANR